MSGLRSAIKAALPESWECILRKHKILTAYVEGVYRSLSYRQKGNTRSQCDGRPAWKHGLDDVKFYFKTKSRLDYCMNQGYAIQIGDQKFWETLQYEIQNYEYMHK